VHGFLETHMGLAGMHLDDISFVTSHCNAAGSLKPSTLRVCYPVCLLPVIVWCPVLTVHESKVGFLKSRVQCTLVGPARFHLHLSVVPREDTVASYSGVR